MENKKADLDKVSGGGVKSFFKKHGRKIAGATATLVAGVALKKAADRKDRRDASKKYTTYLDVTDAANIFRKNYNG